MTKNKLNKEAGLAGLMAAGTAGLAGAASINQASKAKQFMPGFKPATHAALGFTGEGMNINNMIKQAAEQEPAKYDYIRNVAEELKGGPFLEEVMERQNAIIDAAKEKIAGSIWTRNSLGGHMARGAAAVAGTTAAGIGYEALSDLYNDAKGAVTKDRNFKKMMNENPDLAEFDQEKVKSVFKTLHTFAGPKFSADPNIAGTFVRNQVALHQGMPQGVDMGAVNQLISSRGVHERSGKLDRPMNLPGMEIAQHGLAVNKDRLETDRRNNESEKLKFEREKHDYEKANPKGQSGGNFSPPDPVAKSRESDMSTWKHRMEGDKIKAWDQWVKAVEATPPGQPPPPKPPILGGGPPGGGRKGGRNP